MKKPKIYRSDFLFTTPSFLIGVGSTLNIAGNYFPFQYSSSGTEADTKAIESDWGMVGNDIKKATKELRELAF